MIILITGTPGTGKTSLTKEVHESLISEGVTSKIIDINELIHSNVVKSRYDSRLDTKVYDDRDLCKILKQRLIKDRESSEVLLLDTHTPSSIPKDAPDLVVVLKCRTDVIYDRLAARGYIQAKIDENVSCEIMQVVHEEAHDRFTKAEIVVVSSNDSDDLKDNKDTILEHIQSYQKNKPSQI